MDFKGRFFKTLGILISKPGFLSSEYKKGNRSPYLNPLMMYLFTAALFFIIFFTGFRNQNVSFGDTTRKGFVKRGTVHLLKEGYKNAKNKEDSASIEKAIKSLEDSLGNAKKDDDEKGMPLGLFDSTDVNYKTVAGYDSAQGLLPVEKKDGWFDREGKRRFIALNERYGNNARQFWLDISNKFIHYSPYLVFVLLPLYALLLKLVYIRRKQFLFADHSIYLIHVYTVLFMSMLLYLGILSLKQYTNEERLILTAMVILGFACIYALRAMKNFYEQGWAKTIVKFILLNILCIAALLAVFVLFFIISIPWL